jgi:hypothetical protein
VKLYLCSVKLGDSLNHVVTNKPVTIPEIAVLRDVHGQSAVTDIRPIKGEAGIALGLDEESPRTDIEERQRLSQTYENAMPGESVPIVNRLFSPMAALPRTLREIGIDPQAAAAQRRLEAEKLAAEATMLAEEEDAPEAAEDVDVMFDDEPAPAVVAPKAKAA